MWLILCNQIKTWGCVSMTSSFNLTDKDMQIEEKHAATEYMPTPTSTLANTSVNNRLKETNRWGCRCV
jgi:hypothetical protein